MYFHDSSSNITSPESSSRITNGISSCETSIHKKTTPRQLSSSSPNQKTIEKRSNFANHWIFNLLSLLIVLISLTLPSMARATEVALAWDPNNPSPKGYRLFQRTEGQSYNYTQPVWEGTNTSITVYNLEYDTAYYFVVRAYDGDLESADSGEVSFLAPSPPTTNFAISASVNGNGSISPAGTVTVAEGADQSFTITPGSDSYIVDVWVDGVSIGGVTTYTFPQVTQNHTIRADFAYYTHTISASAGTGGSISPTGSASVNHGSSQGYTITPNVGYQVANVLVDGTSVGSVSSYNFDHVVKDHTIQASFIANTFVISASAGTNGSISPAGNVSVSIGSSQTFAISPDSSYKISDVQIDGQSVGPVESYTFTSLNANHSISVSFSENKLVKLWIEAEDGDQQFPMEIAGDESASAGGYVWTPSGTGNLYSPTISAGTAEYHFDVPEAGDYIIWGRQISNNTSSDSFFVSVDGGTEMTWHTKAGGQDVWTWDVVSIRNANEPRDASNPKRFWLEAGAHTFMIKQREDGTKLDRLLITNEIGFTPTDTNSVADVIDFGEVEIDHNWKRINFSKPFFNPVVVAGPISLNGGNPAVVRIQNINQSGFEMRIQEWEYLDGWHTLEKVSYLVIEAGNYTLDNGIKIEAAMLSSDAVADYKQIAFNEKFNVHPVVMTSIVSFNDEDAVTGRINSITTDAFNYRMQEQEGNPKDHKAEKIAYVAWEPSSGQIGDITYVVGKTADQVKHKNYSVQFTEPFTSSPAFIADMQTTD
ncbi:MAG: hypothetical protein PVH26_01880, partial [Desulfosarcina sp.]